MAPSVVDQRARVPVQVGFQFPRELGEALDAGALVLARVDRLVFGAYDEKAGAVASLWDVVRDRRLNHRPEVIGGVLAEESGALLDEFFADRRTERR